MGGMSALVTFSQQLTDSTESDRGIQVDNTTRENKNAALLSYSAWLVATLGFRLVAIMSSRVGHTHNRLGA